jgi:hypothetical protein
MEKAAHVYGNGHPMSVHVVIPAFNEETRAALACTCEGTAVYNAVGFTKHISG